VRTQEDAKVSVTRYDTVESMYKSLEQLNLSAEGGTYSKGYLHQSAAIVD